MGLGAGLGRGHDRSRLALALALSLLAHALLSTVTFGSGDLGLPGLDLPWRQRRGQVPDIQLVLAPEPEPDSAAAGEVAPPAEEPLQQVLPRALQKPDGAAASGQAPPGADVAGALATAGSAGLREIAVERPDAARAAMAPASSAPLPAVAAASSPSSASSPTITQSTQSTQSASAPDPEPAKTASAEAARLEAQREDAARQETAQLEAAKLEAARLESAREQAALQQAARDDAARVQAARQEAERLELAREAARQALERQQAALHDAARQDEARQQAAREAAAQKEAERTRAAADDNERREAARRAMGRQLDEEAAQRRQADAAAGRLPGTPPPAQGSVRRGRLFGRSDANAELVLYAEAWARKIQLNTPPDAAMDAARRPHVNPVVTVAIRRDGSVESVAFMVSSGVPEIDDAVRRTVQRLLPYQPFPPALAREFDVLEIRRTWHFDTAVRLD